MLKLVLIWGAIAILGVAGYIAKNAFDIPDQSIWFAAGIVFIVVISFHFDGRLKALEDRVVHPDYSGTKAAIEEGERHKPQHQQPKSLIEGGAVQSFITPAHEVLFDDFRWFGAVLNQHAADPWSIEELNDTNVRSFDSPEVGRRYQVYYNACEMGTIQVTVGGHEWIFQPETSVENRLARAELDLSYLRFVPYSDAHSLVSTIALFIGQFGDDGDAARSKAATSATAGLTEHLWESVRNSELDTSFEFRTEGPYELLRHTTDHWKAKGIDPFEKWGGDRSWGRSEGA